MKKKLLNVNEMGDSVFNDKMNLIFQNMRKRTDINMVIQNTVKCVSKKREN